MEEKKTPELPSAFAGPMGVLKLHVTQMGYGIQYTPALNDRRFWQGIVTDAGFRDKNGVAPMPVARLHFELVYLDPSEGKGLEGVRFDISPRVIGADIPMNKVEFDAKAEVSPYHFDDQKMLMVTDIALGIWQDRKKAVFGV